MIKAIFFDVDGTLLSHKTKQVPLSTKRCLAELRKNGIKVFVSTGRHLEELKKLPVNEIEFDGYITLNGQLILDAHRESLFSVPFSESITTELVNIFRKQEIPLVLVEEKHIYINGVNDLVEQVQANISSDVPPILPYDNLPIYQATTYLKRGEESKIEYKLPKGCKLTRWSDGGVDIVAENGGKVEGIKKVLEYYDIAPSEIMSFGDAENDIDMIQFTEIGVAMGNGVDEVKAVADYVTTSVDDDGIEKALKYYSII